MSDYNSMEAFAKALNNAYNGLDKAVEVALRRDVKDLVDKIRLRVSTKGQKADGGSFSTPYSRSHAYKRKKYGSGQLAKQVSHKGFFYQGDMWSNFRMLTLVNSGQRINASLGFTGNNAYKTNEELNQIHSTREGIPITAATKEEAVELTRKIGFAIGEYLKSAL